MSFIFKFILKIKDYSTLFSPRVYFITRKIVCKVSPAVFETSPFVFYIFNNFPFFILLKTN